MLHPKNLVLTTPEVTRGEPILIVDYTPPDETEVGQLAGEGGGKIAGWTFLHRIGELPEDAEFYFFNAIEHVDPALKAILEDAIPGTYTRESVSAPFERETE